MTIYEGYAFAGSAVQAVQLPSSLKRVETGTFSNCLHLTSVKFPNGAEYVGNLCFHGSGIEEITLSRLLKEMGKKSVKDCKHLHTAWIDKSFRAEVRKCVHDLVVVQLK